MGGWCSVQRSVQICYSIVIPIWFPQTWHFTTMSPSLSFRMIFLSFFSAVTLSSASRESQCGHCSGGHFRFFTDVQVFISLCLLRHIAVFVEISRMANYYVKKSRVEGDYINPASCSRISIAWWETPNIFDISSAAVWGEQWLDTKL